MIIGISGKISSGKNEAAKIIANKKNYAIIAFADALKRQIRDIYDFSYEQLWGPSEKRNEPDHRYPNENLPEGYLTPRYALQLLGTEFGRKCYPDIWIEKVESAIYKINNGFCYSPDVGPYIRINHSEYNGAIISDVRFPNEADFIKNNNGLLIKIKRDNEKPKHISSHSSETSQEQIPDNYYSGIIENNGSLSFLEEQLDLFLVSYNLL